MRMHIHLLTRRARIFDKFSLIIIIGRMTEKRRYRVEEEREQVKPRKRERYKPIKDQKEDANTRMREREKDLS